MTFGDFHPKWSPWIFAGQMLLLEAEDEMKSKRISEIQNFLAEKMEEAVWDFFRIQTTQCFFLLSVSGRRLPALWRFILQITVCCIRSYVYNVYYRYIYCDSRCTFSWRQSWPSCSSISWMSPLYHFWTQPLTSTESWNGGPGYSEEGAVTKRGWWCFVVLYMLVLCLQSLNERLMIDVA